MGTSIVRRMDDAQLLSMEEVRVLGCLLEKERTTPDDYPLTTNSLMRAANQATSREPVVSYDQRTIESAATSLKAAGLVRFVHTPSGRVSVRYRQVLADAWGLVDAEVVVLGLLMLRGAQTAGELRTRSDRWHSFGSVSEVDSVLGALVRREPSLVVLLDRRPGQKEARWAHRLCGVPIVSDALGEPGAHGAPGPRGQSTAERIALLEATVAELGAQMTELRVQLGLES